jgi:hypothetical protein
MLHDLGCCLIEVCIHDDDIMDGEGDEEVYTDLNVSNMSSRGGTRIASGRPAGSPNRATVDM